MSILSKEQAKKRKSYQGYPNGYYSYKTRDGFVHLIRYGIDMLRDKQAVWCRVYPNGDYSFLTQDDYYHVVRDEVDMLEGLYAVWCVVNTNGSYTYCTRDGVVGTVGIASD